jgi:hypothetical protein
MKVRVLWRKGVFCYSKVDIWVGRLCQHTYHSHTNVYRTNWELHLTLTISTAPAGPGKGGLISMHAWHSVIKRPDKQQKFKGQTYGNHSYYFRPAQCRYQLSVAFQLLQKTH